MEGLGAEVAKAHTRFLGGQIGTVHVKGFFYVWRNVAGRKYHAAPDGLAGGDISHPQQLDAALETATGEVLAQAKAYVIPVKVGETKPVTVPYGTFAMSFTGGAGVRGI